jgi:hypothetical protein
MKNFNITAQVFDLCKDPRQSILYNEVIKSDNIDQAKKQFEFELLVDDIVIQKILSVEEIV